VIDAEVLNFRRGDLIAKDDAGQDFPGLDEARAAALASARELLADNIKSASRNPLDAVIITSESGEQLMMISARDVLPKSRM
jgi:hypothetical protein